MPVPFPRSFALWTTSLLIACGRTPVWGYEACEAGGERPAASVLSCEPGACVTRQVDFRAEPLRVMVLLDRSCSMLSHDGGKRKWSRAIEATSAVVERHGRFVHWGISIFPNPDTESCTHDEPDVAAGPAGAAEVVDLLDAATTPDSTYFPSDDTCFTNLHQALYATGRAKGLEHDTVADYVLLVTDGRDTGCAFSGGQVFHGVETVTNMRELGIQTIVVGFDVGADVEELEDLSKAGGAPSPPSGDYHRAGLEDLDGTLDAIARRLVCSVAVEVDADPSALAVTLDGATIPRSATDGWTYDADRHEVVLHGSPCELLSSRVAERATVTLQCPHDA